MTQSEPSPSAVLALREALVRRGPATLLGPVSWAVAPGERWVVVGPNGSGKTTLVQLVSGWLSPSSGEVHVLGGQLGRVDVRELRRAIGLASAALAAAIPAHLSALDAVVSARAGALVPWYHSWSPADRIRAADLLDRLGAGHLAARRIGTLSTGERQRVAIARALMPDPDLLLLDEPAAGLDLGAREDLVDRLAGLAAASRPAAVVLVTHHVEEVPVGFGHALVLSGGRAVAAGPIGSALTSAILGEAFGLPLVVEAVDGRFAARRARSSAGRPNGDGRTGEPTGGSS